MFSNSHTYFCMFSLFLTLNNFLNNVESKIEPFIRPSIEYGILYRHCQAWYQITWLEYSNEFLSLFPLRPSIIHNISHGFVGWLYCTGPSELGVQEGQSPPPPPPHFCCNYRSTNFSIKRLKLLFIYPLDFQTFLRSYCMYICSTLSSSIHYSIGSSSVPILCTVLVKNTVLCM